MRESQETAGVFINLSNHPSGGWAAAQRQAALALAGGPVMDEPFPDVPPEADLDWVENTAHALTTKLTALGGVRAAMIAGEPTLCLALVAHLQRAGIACYAATTRREVEIKDGVKLSRFTFVQFRAYPQVS